MTMRKFFLFVLIVLMVALGGALWVINNSRAFSSIARAVLQQALPNVRIVELNVGRHQFSWPERAIFQDISCRVGIMGRSVLIQVKALQISGFSTVFSSRKVFTIHWAGGDVEFAPGKARGVAGEVQVSWDRQGVFAAQGPLSAEELLWDKLKTGKTICRLTSDGRRLGLGGIHAEAYGGIISGAGDLVFRPVGYSVNMKIADLKTARLAEFHDQIGAQIAGRISGTVQVFGDFQRPTLINADFFMPSGGKVNAALLSALIQYLPQSPEKKRLGQLIRIGGKLAVEVFSFTIKSNAPDRLAGKVTVASKEANIELNLTHDIHTDGTWDGLAEYWRVLFR